ncbi:MAG: ABC transporter substrate binding protein [Oligosphaeraceae bacterium]
MTGSNDNPRPVRPSATGPLHAARLLLLALLLGGLATLHAIDAAKPATYDFDCQDMALEAKRILVIDSHSHDVGMSKSLNDGMKQAIGEHGAIAMYEHYNLYVCNKPSVLPTPEDIEYLQNLLDKNEYDLIMLNGNPALHLFLNGDLRRPPRTPLLVMSYYGDLAADIAASGLPITGVQTPYVTERNIDLARQLLPSTRKVALIVSAQYNPKSTATRRLTNLFKDQKAEGNDHGLDFQIIDGLRYTTAEMLQKVAELSADGDAVLIYHSWGSVRDILENNYAMLPVIRKRFRGLILSGIASVIPIGTAGGYLIDDLGQGRMVGKMAADILHGQSPTALPVSTGNILLKLDYDALTQWGVQPGNIPTDAQLLNLPTPWFVAHGRAIWSTVTIVIAVLTIVLVFLLLRQRMYGRLRLLVENLPIRITITDGHGHNIISHIPENDTICTLTDSGAPHGAATPNMCACDFMQRNIRACRETQEPISADYVCCGRHRQIQYIPLGRKRLFGKNAVMTLSIDTQALVAMRQRSEQLAEQLACTLKSIGDSVIVTDCDQRITLINDVCAQMTGYSPEEARGKTLEEILPLVSMVNNAKVESPVTRALATRSIVELANHTDLITRDGRRLHIADSAAPVIGPDGDMTGAVMVFRDMTREYNRTEALRKDNSILRQAMALGSFICLTVDHHGVHSRSGEHTGFWPYHDDNTPYAPEEWLAPADVPEFKRQWASVFAGQSNGFTLRYAAGLPGQEKRYFSLSIERVTNEVSGEAEYCGVMQETTELRRQELKYGDNLMLLSSILDHLPACVFVKDAKDHFRYLLANRLIEDFIGKPLDQLVGHTDHDIFHHNDQLYQHFIEQDQGVMRDGKVLEFEDSFTNEQGQHLWLHTIKLPMLMPSGDQLLLGLSIDITAKHQLEAEQALTIAKLNAYVRSEQLVNRILTNALSDDDFYASGRDSLRLLAEFHGADHAFVFRYLDDALDYSRCEHSWGGDEALELLRTEKFSMKRLPGWNERIAGGSDIVIPNTATLSADDEPLLPFLRAKGTKALLVTGIRIAGKLFGYLGLDFTQKPHDFSEGDQQQLHTFASVFGLVMTRHRQWKQLMDSESFMRQVVNSVTLPLTIIDRNYRIILANPSAAAQGNMSPEEAKGTYCYDSLCGNGSPLPACTVKQTIEDLKPHTSESVQKGKYLISTSQPLFDSNGSLKYIMTLDVDVTMQEQQRRILKDALDQAQAANRAKSTFLATISHELRTPLNAVIGFSELLQSHDLSAEEHDDYLQSINVAGNALLSLINDVLDITKLDANKLHLNLMDINLLKLIIEVISMFKLKAIEKKLSLDYSCFGLEHRTLSLDGPRLRQVLFNLIGNSVKFTRQGGVKVRVEFAPNADGKAGQLSIRIIDSGPGIAPEKQQHIFDPFVQDASVERSFNNEGTGLGLAISRRLVEQMNGKLTLASTPGKGSIFIISLPDVPFTLNEDQDEDLAARVIVDRGQPLKENEKASYTILAVDDVALNLKVLGAVLRRLNHTCLLAASAEEAIRLLQDGADVDMVFTDMWMPNMNGQQLAEHLKADPRFHSLPIIAVTADVQVADTQDTPFDDILLKPFTIDSISAVIDRAVGGLGQPLTPPDEPSALTTT